MLFSFSDRSLHKTVPSPETSIERSLLMIILKILGEMARTPCTKYARYSFKSSGLLWGTCIQEGGCVTTVCRGESLWHQAQAVPHGSCWAASAHSHRRPKALLDSSALKCLVQRLHIIPDLSAWIKLDKLCNWRCLCTSIKVIKP